MMYFALGQGTLIDLTLRSSCVLGVAWLLTMLLRRRSAAARHLIWAAAFCGLLVLPVAQRFAPAWPVLSTVRSFAVESHADAPDAIDGESAQLAILPLNQVFHDRQVSPPAMAKTNRVSQDTKIEAAPDAEALEMPLSSEMENRASSELFQVSNSPIVNTENTILSVWPRAFQALRFIWLGGVAICCMPLLLGMASVFHLRRSSHPASAAIIAEVQQLSTRLHLSRRVVVLLTSQRAMPMTWGVITPILLLPDSAMTWTVERRRMVLMHELAHVRRCDCLTQMLGQLVRALHWFNPLAWLALRQLRIEQERACDDIVLNSGASAADYAAELLSIAARLPRTTWDTAVALAMSRTTRIEQRLRSILQPDCERRPMSWSRVIVSLGVMFAISIGLATAQWQTAAAEASPARPDAVNDSSVESKTPPPKQSADGKTESAEKQNLGIDNGDFEGPTQVNGHPESWHAAHLKETVQFVKLALETTGHSGKQSALISIAKSHPLQPVSYNWSTSPRGWKPGQAFEISAWVKTENVTSSPMLVAQCWNKNQQGLAISTSEPKFKLTGTNDWTRISTLILVPADTDKLVVRAALAMPENAGAKVWFDDFAIAATDADKAQAATRTLTPVERAAVEQIKNQQRPAAQPITAKPEASLKEVLEKITTASASSVDTNALHEAAIRGMVDSLKDPYSTLITSEQMSEINQQLDGKLTGVGASLAREADDIVVLSLLPNSPAIRGGLKPRDVIVEINGQPAKDLVAAVKAIRGMAGTDMTLKIRRGDTLEQLTLKRGAIKVPSVRGLLLDDQGQWRYWLDVEQKIAYVQLAMFDQETHTVLKDTLTRLKEQEAKGLILDLRGNVGGSLMPCIEVARLILKPGVIVQFRGRQTDLNSVQNFEVLHPSQFTELPMVVLIDPTTASAGELLAAALKDNQRAILIGERTFGKGSVQSIFPLSNGGFSLKLTTAQMFSPTGHPLHRSADSKSWGVDPHDGYFLPMTAEQRTARGKAFRDRDSGVLQFPLSPSPEFLEQDAADLQLAGAFKAMLSKVKLGEFTKTGRPLADQQVLLSQREELRKQRDALRDQLELLDKKLGEVR